MKWVRKEWPLVALVLLTLSLPILQHFMFGRVAIIDHTTSHSVISLDDRTLGGQSVSTLETTGEGTQLTCDIVRDYQWPYCLATFILRENLKPIDFTQFDLIRLYIRSEGPGKQYLKIYLRNATQDSGLLNDITYKVNEIHYDPNQYPYPLDVPLENFIVAHWWLNEMGTSPLMSQPEMNAVVQIDVATGDSREPGKHTIVIDRIEFHGKWLSYAQVASILLISWFSYAIYQLFLSIQKARRDAEEAKVSKQALENINASLTVEKAELKAQASQDNLTGAFNRSGLRQYFIKFLNDFRRYDNAFAIIFIDIDHFKNINDTHGHDTGDKVLEHFCHLITDATRQEDILGRWGGEEFILLCPQTDQNSASQLAEKLRITIREASWPNNIRVTSSFGVAEIREGEEVSDLIKRADSALYQAKSAGRDQVISVR